MNPSILACGASVVCALVLLPAFSQAAEAGPGEKKEPAASAGAGWAERLERAAVSPDSWRARAAEIRMQVLVAAGLWPSFDRPPLQPVIFGKLERDGYTVEKVHLETWPGFHLTGNLYRPRGKTGPFPGVVSPHGHAKEGRFCDGADTSTPGLALTLARLGFVVFTYDMVGYGDLKQVPHKFGEPAWGVSLLGVQLWDSLRAVDFVASLPDVDPKRIGATGASGGGTQTFLLTAVDERIACAAPVCMVAAQFQGGCLCENAPLLRIDLNNVEIAACAAPRPLLLVAATGDWTKDNPTLEGPAIRKVYATLGVPERFACAQYEAGHNYNKDSRETVYAWFVRQLQGEPGKDGRPAAVVRPESGAEVICEPAFTIEKREDLAVFGPGHPLPEGAVNATGLAKLLKERVRAQLEDLRPKDTESLARFREVILPALRYTLAARWPAKSEIKAVAAVPKGAFGVSTPHASVLLQTAFLDEPDLLKSKPTVVVLVVPAGWDDSQIRKDLLESKSPCVAMPPPEAAAGFRPAGGTKEQLAQYKTTYFPSALSVQVDGILGTLAWLAGRDEKPAIRLVGLGEAGIPVLLARALAPPGVKIEKAIVDVMGLDDAAEATWTGDRAQPGILRSGGLRAAGILAAAGPGELVIHNTQGKFDAAWIKDAFKAAGREQALTVLEQAWTVEQILGAAR
jgi:dienelactone hydrolase